MHPHAVSDRFSAKEDAFPDDFIMVPGGYGHSFTLDASRSSAEKEAARPMDQIQGLDPCKITDEERELLQRFKRRQDAFKTALCDTFRRNGSCTYGEACRFAHNQEELRVPTQPRGRMHPKYKTVLCENFERDGECKYGSRCMYIHRRREDKLNDLLKYRPEAVPSFQGQSVASLQSMDHRPPRHDKDRRSYRASSRGFTPAVALHNQTFSDFAFQHTWNPDLSLPHFIQDNSLIHNSSSHEKLANITRTAPSPTNPYDMMDGRRSRGSDDLNNRMGRMKISNSRYPKEG